MKIRSFISLELPLSLKHELYEQSKFIAGNDKRQKIRWLLPENYHLTLIFLGDVDTARLSGLQFALESKLASTKAIPCKISEITPFPFSRSAKIIAALLERTVELLKLQSDVANCVRSYGISVERRRFVPHVTLGRLKSHSGKAVNFQPLTIFFEGEANAVTLYQSQLTPDGAIHTALADVPLQTML